VALEKIEHMQVAGATLDSSMLVWALNLLLACCTEFRCVTVLPIYIHLNSGEQCLHPYLCSFQVPVDIAPKFGTANKLLGNV